MHAVAAGVAAAAGARPDRHIPWTIPPPLLTLLAQDTSPLPRPLTPTPEGTAAECTDSGKISAESAFRWYLASNGAVN
jgi:hypothetical protein